MANESGGQTQALGKGVKVALIVGAALIVVLLGAVVLLLSSRTNSAQTEVEETPNRSVLVTPENVEETVEEIVQEKYVAPGYFEVEMSNVWHFATGEAISEDAYVANPMRNSNDVYFDLFVSDDMSNPVLESPVIPRGGAFENFALDAKLNAGTYDCVMIYHLVDENQNTLSTLQVTVTVIVEG